ncbi:MAG: ribosomal RNA small subunit methyltransferase A [Bdellovibrionaceae bacterium]|nr:ribosomal RNA small subunit methyltransferase A [Pseudobdellovibrionaceae bacterium]MBC7456998.1 ribosomal RNA small subunit methyltransferase A [Pseudobdellovibrionaceae bacterium]
MSNAFDRLKKRQDELGILAKKSLGQNFLVSDNVIEKIIAAADGFNAERVIEIGPGCGALTDILLEKYKNLKLIELDRSLFDFWKSKDIDIINVDALQTDWTIYSDYLLVSNLPYQISSSLVIDRSLDAKPLVGMVLMFQKEVAQRIRSIEQSEHYGMLSVIAQEFWQIKTVTDAGPRDFNPAPKVASRVLEFRPKVSNITDKAEYLHFVKAAFKQRRRILKTNLAALDKKFQVDLLGDWLIQNKKSEKVRAEELSVVQINSLYHHLKVK